jgi:tetratricopeptide (TPR) repeat protein
MHKKNCKCEKYLKEGLLASQSGKWQEAIAAYEDAIRIHEDNEKAWGNMGLCYGALGDSEKALDCLEEAINYNPEYAFAWNNKGSILAEQGKIAEALECFEKAIEIDPDYKEAVENKDKALSEIRLGDTGNSGSKNDMKKFKVVIQSLVGENIKKELLIEARTEEQAKEIAENILIKEELDGMFLDSPSLMITAEEV